MKKFFIFLIAVLTLITLTSCNLTGEISDAAPENKSAEDTGFLSELRAAQAALTDETESITETETEEESKEILTFEEITDSDTEAVPDRSVGEGKVQTVYITPTGKKYHFSEKCGGKNSFSVTFDEALSRGLTPCKKCAK